MKSLIILLVISLFLMSSCNRAFEPIEYGKEACYHCKMTIVDRRYAAEMITEKGKVFKFDDIACLIHYMSENKSIDPNTKLYVAKYQHANDSFLDARKAFYLTNDFFKSPMKGNTAAFSSPEDTKSLKDSLKCTIMTWGELKY